MRFADIGFCDDDEEKQELLQFTAMGKAIAIQVVFTTRIRHSLHGTLQRPEAKVAAEALRCQHIKRIQSSAHRCQRQSVSKGWQESRGREMLVTGAQYAPYSEPIFRAVHALHYA